MLKKLLMVIVLLNITIAISAHTLFIDAKKFGQGQDQHMAYPYVADYGRNTAGSFIIRFTNGQEISLGQPSHWEKFEYTILPDSDELSK